MSIFIFSFRVVKTPSKLKPKAQVKNEPARKRLKRSNEEKGESDFLPTKVPKRVKNKPQFLLTLPVEIFIEVSPSVTSISTLYHLIVGT